jgi:hypothetical protein
VLFVGYRVRPQAQADPQSQTITYSFAGIWEYFFDNVKYQKLYLTYDGAEMVAAFTDEFTLGLSLQTLTGEADTVPGTTATNYMSIAQEIKAIMAFAANASALDFAAGKLPNATDYAAVAGTYVPGVTTGTPGIPAGAQFGFDQNTLDATTGDYLLTPSPSANALIPDFAPGYGSALPGSATKNSTATLSQILRAPNNSVNNIMCSDALREELKWLGGLGGVTTWWDCTQSPPLARFSTRDQLTAVNLPITPGSGVTLRTAIEPRDDLIPNAVHFKYNVSGSLAGTPYSAVKHDIAFYSATDGAVIEGVGYWGKLTNLAGALWDGPHQTLFQNAALMSHVVGGTFNYQGLSTYQLSGTINSAAVTPGTASWWAQVCPKLANAVTNGTLAFNAAGPGAAFLVVDAGTSGLTNGTVYPIASLPGGLGYYLLPGSGGIAPWMQVGDSSSGAAAQYISVKVRVQFTYSEQITAAAGSTAVPTAAKTDEVDVDLVLTNLEARTYHSAAEVIAGEPIPNGLAQYIFDLQSIEQYEGSISVSQVDVTNLVPPGSALNLTGGAAAWSDMAAQVQEITLEGDAGNARATYSFGPAKHLGLADLNEVLRVNHGPRWANLFGTNVLNTASGSGTTALPAGTSSSGTGGAGSQALAMQMFPSNITDLQQFGGSYVIPPGVTFWGKGKQPSGFSTLDAGPGLIVGDGSAGVQNGQYILISLTQLAAIATASQPVKFFELNTCEGGDSTYYRTFLCTDKYHKS